MQLRLSKLKGESAEYGSNPSLENWQKSSFLQDFKGKVILETWVPWEGIEKVAVS